MSHQDTLEHFDVQTNQSSEIASLGGGSTDHAGYGRFGFAQLEELPSVVAGANDDTDAIVADGKTPTLSIHTFPAPLAAVWRPRHPSTSAAPTP